MEKIIPATTSIPLSERFKILENKAVEQAPQPAVVGPARSLMLAMNMANQSTRPNVRERLGPKLVTDEPNLFHVRNSPTVFVNSNKRFFNQRLKPVRFANQFRKPFKRNNIQTQQPQRIFLNRVSQVRPHVPQPKTKAPNKFADSKRFSWRNPALVKKPLRKPAKANKDQLDNDLDAYMAQSTGYLNSGFNVMFTS
jgi:hypothetical protein